MKIIAFSASSSRESINKKLVTYAASLVEGADVEVIDINEYEMPLFSEDREKELGQPELAKAFFSKLGEADGIIISFAEHNGSYTAAYKNLFDWTSRVNMKVFQDKPVVMLSTSPGPGGAKSVLGAATASSPYFGANLKGQLSVSSFYDVYDAENGVINDEAIASELKTVVNAINV
ncbi:NADPH-dependent FMN reductase [Vibrio tapetis]|uniref:Putative Flavoprotein n=1 Tax=Vibrio tapetis subsp. tapetis TaxID=1671868 RepID=A0A2N8ZMW1_9VIBR|nr:NAD(P)H-dependent oxidoreductase [Vibrio tapetis]SON53245.1 putative Flavoprotein [Vibrio tapetis subsp. tapetis]